MHSIQLLTMLLPVIPRQPSLTAPSFQLRHIRSPTPQLCHLTCGSPSRLQGETGAMKPLCLGPVLWQRCQWCFMVWLLMVGFVGDDRGKSISDRFTNTDALKMMKIVVRAIRINMILILIVIITMILLIIKEKRRQWVC